MGKPNRKKDRRKKKKPKKIIHLLAFGEGPNPGYAHRVAEKAIRLKKDVKVLSVDLQRPNYPLPNTMGFVHSNALKYLESVNPASVKKVREAYVFQYTGHGKRMTTEEHYKKGEAQVRKAMDRGGGKVIEQFKKNQRQYVKLVKRVLVPGGQFIVITSPKSSPPIVALLEKEGFNVTKRKLTYKEILRAGSPRAIDELSKDKDVLCIKATKPKPVSN